MALLLIYDSTGVYVSFNFNEIGFFKLGLLFRPLDGELVAQHKS